MGYKEGMGVLHIRDFPDDLQRALRLAAVETNETMKAIIERACERELERMRKERRIR